MNKLLRTGKKIVSKDEYVAVQTSRTLFRVSALASIVEVAVCVALMVSLPFFGFGWVGWVAALFCGIIAYRFGKMRLAKLKVAADIEEVIPLTRANIATLPESKTLARASFQPPQEQQHILLRAATSTQETPANQLLRAAEGRAEPAEHSISASPTCALEEHVQEQQTVLLYTAASDLETPAEQIVRVTGGSHE